MTEEQAKKALVKIIHSLKTFVEDNDPIETLEGMIDMLDEFSAGTDFFGTEGWRHTFGFED
jgi:hypothetical protein